MPLFRDARLKFQRAHKHLGDLRNGIGALKESYTSIIQQHPDIGLQQLEHSIANYESSIADLALVAGDAIHNFRATLDYAWYSAMSARGTASGFSKFPIGQSRKNLEDILYGIKVDAAIFQIMVEEFKAYKGGDIFIWTLHDLDISDKHIFLLGLSPLAGINEITVEDENGREVTGGTMLITDPPPYRIAFKQTWKIKNQGKLSFEIAIKEAGDFQSVEVMEMLRLFSIVVMHCVHRLEEL